MRIHKQKRDITEASIVDALRKSGATVYLLDQPCDALAGLHGQSHLLEFKTGKGKLTADQQKFQSTWRGSPVVILRTVDEALAFVKTCKAEHALKVAKFVDQMRKSA